MHINIRRDRMYILNKAVDKIVWFIPIKSIRNKVRNRINKYF